jgi:hypothetical protein
MDKVQKSSNSEGRERVGHLQFGMEVIIAYGRLKLGNVAKVLPKITFLM